MSGAARTPFPRRSLARLAAAGIVLFARLVTAVRGIWTGAPPGLYRLAAARPDIELVPVWIDNLNRVLPKGERVPIPLVCTVTFGAALRLGAGESETAFLERAAGALLALAPGGALR